MRKKDKKFILIHCNFRVIFFSLVAPVQHTCTYLKYREQTDGETSTKQAIETTSEPPQTVAGDEVKFDVRNIIGTFSSDQSIVVVLLVQGGTKTNMASLKERLNDNEYKLWIKASLCLHYTKKGIGIFTDDRCKKTHAFVKTAVEKHAIVKNPDGDIKAMSEICNNAKVVKRGNRWSLGCCNDCEIYVKEIAHLSQPPFRIELSNWCNSEVQLWPSEPWEIAKVYMNKGQRPFAFQRNSQETDLSGLLNFIDHCRVPRVDIQNMDNITKVRDARNATMHSASMKMSNADFLVHTDAMIALLQDPLFMDKIEEAQNAVKEIQKILQIDFVITSTDEFRVLTDKTSSLQEQNDRLQEEVNALKVKHTELENSTALHDETTRNLVKTETDQREADINTLKAEINEKEKQLKELSTELILVKKLVNQDRDLYRKMDIRVRNVETCWDKTASELTEVKQSHQVLAEQVQRIQQEMQIGECSNLNSKNMAQLDGHVHKCEDEVELLNEKLTKTQHELEDCRSRNKELVHRLSFASQQNIKVQDKTNLLATEKANKELAAVKERLTEEVRRLQSELRQTKEPDNVMECTKTTCKSRIEALEYRTEILESENKSLRSTYDMRKLYAFEERCAILEAQLAEKEKNDTVIEELKYDLLTERKNNTQYENLKQNLSADIKRISTEKDLLQDEWKKAEIKLKTQMQICQQEQENQDIELKKRNKQIETLVSENEKINKESQKYSKILFEYRLQAESNIKSLNEQIQSLTLENNTLNKELHRNIKQSDEQRLQAQTSFDSLKVKLAQLEVDLRSKVDDCQRLMQENTALKATVEGDNEKSDLAEAARETKEELHDDLTEDEESQISDNKQMSSAEERPTGKRRRNISQLSARKSGSIEIKAKDDKDCDILGMAVTNNGTILLADWKNSNIKSVSPDNKVLSVLSLPASPRAITVQDTTTAVVEAFNHKLYIINITENKTLSLRSEYQLDYGILAMVAYNGNLAVTCDTSPGTTNLITIDGRVLWSVCRDTTGPNLFHLPVGITITSITDTTAVVVVSDLEKNTLTLLEAQTGKFIRSIDVGEWKNPWGITTDSDGNVYVCYRGKNEIGVWSADFQESKILLSGGDKVGTSPRCIVYSAVDDSLYVSYSNDSRSRNTVDRFRLA